ncbi:unnamed protein product [Urochloa humidicola]
MSAIQPRVNRILRFAQCHRGTNEGRKKGQTTEMSSKRPRKESQSQGDDAETRRGCSPRTPKPLMRVVPSSRSPARQRYLYLVLDDWKRGYSIHRLGEADLEPEAPVDARPAEYPLVRVQAQHTYLTSGCFASHGTKILAMNPTGFSPGIPVFDTETLEMAVYPLPKSRKVMGFCNHVHTSVGDRLVSFIFRCLEVLGPEPSEPSDESWSWTTVEPLPPFDSRHVSSYALHPDGRTIFMSVKGWSSSTTTRDKDKRSSTFTFDTERMEWTHLGEWLLPFKGRAHYDRELDAWVGICRFKEGAGHVYCCDVPPATAGCNATTMPAWKLGKDLIFDEGSSGHSGATLVYMGDSRFCLIESRMPEYYQPPRVLAITCFGLKYDKVGELVTTQYRAHAAISYQTVLKNLGTDLDPVAFWM